MGTKIYFRRNSGNIYIQKREVLFCLLFYNVLGIQQIQWLAILSDVFRIAIAFGIIIKYIYRNINFSFKKNKLIIYTTLIAAITLLSTFINSDTLLSVLIRYAPIISLFMYMTFYKGRIISFLYSVFIASEILIYMNLFTMILFPDGIFLGKNMAPYWVIGQKQDFATVFVISTVISILFLKNGIKEIRSYALLVAMFISIALAVSIGIIVFWCVLFILLLLPTKVRKVFKPSILLWTYLIINIAMIWLALNYRELLFLQSIFRNFATTGMTKDETFGIRTLMWLDALSLTLRHPIIGNGLISEARWGSINGMLTAYHPHFHNMVFDLLATGGICSLAVYISIQTTLVKKLNVANGNRTAYYLTACIFAMNVHSLIECYYAPLYWAVYMCAFYWDEIERRMEEYKLKRLSVATGVKI